MSLEYPKWEYKCECCGKPYITYVKRSETGHRNVCDDCNYETIKKRLTEHDKAYEDTIWFKDMLLRAFEEIRSLQERVIKLESKHRGHELYGS